MKHTRYFMAFAATIMAAAPALAAPASNPALPLSIDRAATPSHGKSKLAGPGAIIVGVLALGILAGGIYAVADNHDRPASN